VRQKTTKAVTTPPASPAPEPCGEDQSPVPTPQEKADAAPRPLSQGLCFSLPAAAGGPVAWLDPDLLAALVNDRIVAPVPEAMTDTEEEPEEDEAEQDASPLASRIHALDQRLERIEAALHLLVQQRAEKDWYSTAELAELLGKAEFTVREWCRLGRVNARKRECGRGQSQEWVISHAELERIKNEGLLPQPRVSTRL
jgi:hypothetical protein